MDNHEAEEQLDAPQVKGVHEQTQRRDVPPRHAADRQESSRDDDDCQSRQRQDTEDIDPRGDVDRLTVRESLPSRNQPNDPGTKPDGPAAGIVGVARSRRVGAGRHGSRRSLSVACSWPDPKGTTRARTNTTTIAAMIKRLVTEISTTPQCTYRPALSVTMLNVLITVTFFAWRTGHLRLR